jgi:hypothetical protein
LPTTFPSELPTLKPTGIQNYRVVGSSADGTTGSDTLIIDSKVNVELRGNGGDDTYIVHSSPGRDITIIDFSNGPNNVLDLSEGFPEITTYGEIKARITRDESNVHFRNEMTTLTTEEQLILALPENQNIILLNIPSNFNLDESNFVLAPSSGTGSKKSEKTSITDLVGAVLGSAGGFTLIGGGLYKTYFFAKSFAKGYNLRLLEDTFVKSSSSRVSFLDWFEIIAYWVFISTSWVCCVHFLTVSTAEKLKNEFLEQLRKSYHSCVPDATDIKTDLKTFLNNHSHIGFEENDYKISAIVQEVKRRAALGYSSPEILARGYRPNTVVPTQVDMELSL